MPQSTFIAECGAGRADPTAIDAWIEAWHSNDDTRELHEALGMTIEEYAGWVKDPTILPEIIARHG